jgi:hypothetical protein
MATNGNIGFLLAKYLNIFSSKTTDLFELETLLESSFFKRRLICEKLTDAVCQNMAIALLSWKKGPQKTKR